MLPTSIQTLAKLPNMVYKVLYRTNGLQGQQYNATSVAEMIVCSSYWLPLIPKKDILKYFNKLNSPRGLINYMLPMLLGTWLVPSQQVPSQNLIHANEFTMDASTEARKHPMGFRMWFSLGKMLRFVAQEVLQTFGQGILEKWAHKYDLWAQNPRLRFCTQRCGAKSMTGIDDLAHGGYRASLKEEGAISSIMRCLVKMAKIIFECYVWANVAQDEGSN